MFQKNNKITHFIAKHHGNFEREFLNFWKNLLLKISKTPNGGDALKHLHIRASISTPWKINLFSSFDFAYSKTKTGINIFSTDFAIPTNAGLTYPVTETPRAFKYCFKSEATFSQNDCASKYYSCFDRILPFLLCLSLSLKSKFR